ncbi:MAG TPA: 4-alpha-glucanotransferase, partial [Dehalococcoidia bacterium]|nr:4-alpha-glucanotransferase [Dehalococcoidia bacterium]
MPEPLRGLAQLARLSGVQTAYQDTEGRRHVASSRTLLSVLRALGLDVSGPADVARELRRLRQERWRRLIEPVSLAWDGAAQPLTLRLPASAGGKVAVYVRPEEGAGEQAISVGLAGLEERASAEVEGVRYVERALPLPWALPSGYHRLEVEAGRQRAEALLISAPGRVFARPGRRWGAFLPAYALHSHDSWGAGNLSDLRHAAEWTGRLGGSFFGTLPLLSAFLGEPFEPGPYRPVSRLFWSEFFLDVNCIPELAECADALKTVASPEFQREIAELRSLPLVDYRRQALLLRRVLQPLADYFFAEERSRRPQFDRFLEDRPEAVDYARFRAATERSPQGWATWPDPQRRGAIQPSDFDPAAGHYHLYVQWLLSEQLAAAASTGAGLYLDMPLGVHPLGYDVWREQDLFVQGASAGAPPDDFFAGGQDWGVPPPHPQRLREQGYTYLRDALRNQMRYASMLRIDHVMGLHRLFWVPSGCPATEGVYVSYPAEELYAIVCLESQRERCEVVGEDLGTVPRYVRREMSRHGLLRSYVLQFSLHGDRQQA